MSTHTTILPSLSRLESVFASIAGQTGAVWLDSALSFDDRGRFSIIGRNPVAEIAIERGRGAISFFGNRSRFGSSVATQPLDSIGEALDRLEAMVTEHHVAIGYVSYEASLPFVGLAPERGRADMRFFIYDSVLRLDHGTGDCKSSNPDLDDYRDLIDAEIDWPISTEGKGPSVTAAMSRGEYLKRVKQIKWHIHEGDIYQANFTTRFEVANSSAPFETYRRLRRLNPGPYCAYLNFGERQVLSSSPERMFEKQNQRISTAPIKGTIARGGNGSDEAANMKRLVASAKDRAELLMIVDLVRNDLGRVAETGSVRVDSIFTPEIYSSLIHLVSDVSATLKPETSLEQILTALMPGGSITGAPKRRAVEIISQLETVPRSVYTGCIGYVEDNRADFNIAIRTIEHVDGQYYIHAGGGIVADSSPDAEYEEMLLKARNLLGAVGVDAGELSW